MRSASPDDEAKALFLAAVHVCEPTIVDEPDVEILSVRFETVDELWSWATTVGGLEAVARTLTPASRHQVRAVLQGMLRQIVQQPTSTIHDTEGAAMYALFVVSEVVEGQGEAALTMLKENIGPQVKSADGLINATFGRTEDGHLRSMTLFETEDQARGLVAAVEAIPPGAPIKVKEHEVMEVVLRI